MSVSRILAVLAWAVPAAVFAVSGAAKIVDPQGVPPRVAEGIAASVSWPVVLRALGVVEVAVAALLAFRATRPGGRVAAAVLLVGFTAAVAWSAGDPVFLANCGCFGGLDLPNRSHEGDLLLVLARNALLTGLVALGAFLGRPSGAGTSDAVVNAVGLAVVVLLGGLYVSESAMREQDRGGARDFRMGVARSRSAGAFPDIPLVGADGARTSSADALRSGDVVVFYSSSCGACRRSSPSWPAFSRRLALRGQRLVLVGLDAKTPEWIQTSTTGDLPRFSLADRQDATRLGVTSVPYWMALGTDRRVVFDESRGSLPSFAAPLALAGVRVSGLHDATWDRLVEACFGAGTQRVGPPAPAGASGLFAVDVTRDGAAAGRLVVVPAGGSAAFAVEMAVALDPGGVVRAVLPLAAGGYAMLVDPELRPVDALVGMTPAKAVEEATRRAKEPTLEAPIWGQLAVGMRAISELPAR